MVKAMLERSRRIAKPRGIAISDNLFAEIKTITKDTMSVSAFLRSAALKEIERIKNDQRNKTF
jgi:hypothetical protein